MSTNSPGSLDFLLCISHRRVQQAPLRSIEVERSAQGGCCGASGDGISSGSRSTESKSYICPNGGAQLAFGNGREVKIAQDVAGFGCPSVLITGRTDVEPADNLVVITVPAFDNEIADAILQIIAAQLVVGEMQDAAGLTNITFRYRQTDTKLKPWSPTEL